MQFAWRVPTVDDRLVQEVVRTVLAAIYEPVFSKHSHGFRPGRSCHTALDEIRHTWTGCKWLIEVDVRGFFDNIDHSILLKLLERRIDDRKFVGLIKDMLEAGCLDDWVFERTYSGAPQGGIASPILANIYLHELDEFMDEMRAGFDRGAKRRDNTAYETLSRRIHRLRKKIDALRAAQASEAEVRECLRQIEAQEEDRRKQPSVDPMDPGFKRLRYCRYADDFLIGIIGSKTEANEVMAAVQGFLGGRLNLTVSDEKSGVRHASKGSRFLGYHICAFTLRSPGTMDRRAGRGGRTLRVRRRPTTGGIKLWVPLDRVQAFCKTKGYGVLATFEGRHRPQFLESSDLEILLSFNSELRGFANYYALADGVKSSLDRLMLVANRSLFKTLAMRHKSWVPKQRDKLRIGSDYGVKYVVRGEPRTLMMWRLKHLEVRRWYSPDVDHIPVGSRLAQSRNDLVARLQAETCEACGSTTAPFEMHHVRRLKDVRDVPLTPWKRISRARKTIVLCRPCHVAIHAGQRSAGTESRVH